MKVFLSYSLQDSELFVVTLLYEKLRQEGYNVDSSDSFIGENIGEYKIKSSQLFIGIITNDSESIKKVIYEWRLAKQDNTKSLILVEKGVNINDPSLKYVVFDRNNPESAIEELLQLQENNNSQGYSSNTVGVIAIAVVLVAVAAIVALLSKSNESK